MSDGTSKRESPKGRGVKPTTSKRNLRLKFGAFALIMITLVLCLRLSVKSRDGYRKRQEIRYAYISLQNVKPQINAGAESRVGAAVLVTGIPQCRT